MFHNNEIHWFEGCAECIPHWVIIFLVVGAFLAGYFIRRWAEQRKEDNRRKTNEL
jgi:cytochrome b561